jgi:thiol-disulfide isomerase/thioredoxin
MAPLPPVELYTLDSQAADLHTLIDGRVAVVNLWASWCEACESEWPALNRLAANVEKSDAVVVGVAVGEAHATVNAFLERHPSAYVQLVDEDFRFADFLGRRRVPTTLVIDRRGRIVYTGGAMDGRLLAALRRASSEPRDAPLARVRTK